MSSPLPKSKSTPFFSVIIPTRNRPTEFSQALNSVLNQSWTDTEIIVAERWLRNRASSRISTHT